VQVDPLERRGSGEREGAGGAYVCSGEYVYCSALCSHGARTRWQSLAGADGHVSRRPYGQIALDRTRP